MLLRAGARVIVTTRFPHDAALRYARERDYDAFRDRLEIFGLDLRLTPSVERFARFLDGHLPRLDFIIHNACQTVRRPPGFYAHLVLRELSPPSSLPEEARLLVAAHHEAQGAKRSPNEPALAAKPAGARAPVRGRGDALAARFDARGSRAPRPRRSLPRGGARSRFAANRPARDQQLAHDARRRADGGAPRGAARQCHRPVRPLEPAEGIDDEKPLPRQTHRERLGHGGAVLPGAQDGQTPAHEHGQSGAEHADAHLGAGLREGRHPHEQRGHRLGHGRRSRRLASRKQAIHGFHPPLDIVDGAARICDPIFAGLEAGEHAFGQFFKDYKPSPW